VAPLAGAMPACGCYARFRAMRTELLLQAVYTADFSAILVDNLAPISYHYSG